MLGIGSSGRFELGFELNGKCMFRTWRTGKNYSHWNLDSHFLEDRAKFALLFVFDFCIQSLAGKVVWYTGKSDGVGAVEEYRQRPSLPHSCPTISARLSSGQNADTEDQMSRGVSNSGRAKEKGKG